MPFAPATIATMPEASVYYRRYLQPRGKHQGSGEHVGFTIYLSPTYHVVRTPDSLCSKFRGNLLADVLVVLSEWAICKNPSGSMSGHVYIRYGQGYDKADIEA